MTDTKRYFLCGDLYDRAKSEGASPVRLARLKAWESHLAECAREAQRHPFTIADLFAAFNKSLS